MTTSETHFLSDLLPGNKPPKFVLGYLVASLMDDVYDAILDEFLAQEEKKEISKAKLAARIERDPAQITRWLSGPRNFELETIGLLLTGMGRKLEVRVVNIKDESQEAGNASTDGPAESVAETQLASMSAATADGRNKVIRLKDMRKRGIDGERGLGSGPQETDQLRRIG